ncbi:MAG: outer membrane protein assembly factor [Candidatus Omnitrophica bacterium]|nr:outer membrane protein assembly factor [Candidatus Omnitrophota bacterium]
MVTKTAEEPSVLGIDNVLGEDTSIRATGRLFEDYRYIKVAVEKRHIFNSPYFLGIDVDGRLWNATEFDLNGEGAGFYGGRMFGNSVKLMARYRFERYDVTDTDSASAVDFRDVKGVNDISAASLILERDTTNNALYPTKGSQLAGRAELVAKTIGSDFNYTRFEGEAAFYHTPFSEITLCAHAQLGVMSDFGSTQEVPFYERYFVGSGSTVRGFKWGRVGPMSAQNNPLGDNCILIGNLEARRPIYKKLTGAVFFDAGKTFHDFSDIDKNDLRESAGLGLRYLTPWVVLRADYGFILDRKPGDNLGKLHLTISMPF